MLRYRKHIKLRHRKDFLLRVVVDSIRDKPFTCRELINHIWHREPNTAYEAVSSILLYLQKIAYIKAVGTGKLVKIWVRKSGEN